ncbi:IS30 family transposase [Gemmatimonadota bacterium]
MDRREAHGRLGYQTRAEIRTRIAAGQTHVEVASSVGCSTKTVQRIIVRSGGLPPRKKVRCPHCLSLADREEISRGLRGGDSLRQIAGRLGRAPSTISREVAANGSKKKYRAWRAERRAFQRARRPKRLKLAENSELKIVVEGLLERRWSPEQISHRLKLDYPDNPRMHVSHETIYRSLFVPTRGALRRGLTSYLRTGRKRRKARRKPDGAGRLKHRIPITDRPVEALDRSVSGHWEGDLIFGKLGHSTIGVLVERRSRFVLLLRLSAGMVASRFREVPTQRLGALPRKLRKTLTWDQGKEMAEHFRFTMETGIPVFFCEPRRPWQRATSENTNGLLRQYFPRSSDLSVHSQSDLDGVAEELNSRPRQTLRWMKPCEIFAKTVAMTV